MELVQISGLFGSWIGVVGEDSKVDVAVRCNFRKIERIDPNEGQAFERIFSCLNDLPESGRRHLVQTMGNIL